MTVTLTPYLSFRDTARPAMEFYRTVFGGDLTIDTFSGYDMGQNRSDDDLVLHAQLVFGDGLTLMASDTPSGMPYAPPAGFSVSVSGDDAPTLERWWSGLADGGQTLMPLEPPPWGGRFGMLRDRFGVTWMVSIADASEASPGAP